MLNNVSWSEYLVIIGILTGSYYFFIGAKYFQKEIRQLFKEKFNKREHSESGSPVKQTSEATDGTSSYDELETIVNDLRYAILEKAGKNANKSELLEQLKQRLANYAGLRKPAFRVAINNYLITNTKEICGVVFSEDELNSAWETLSR